MDDRCAIIDEPATPEYVLEVFQAVLRQATREDSCVAAKAVLTFDSSVTEWREAMALDELPFDGTSLGDLLALGESIETFFQADITIFEWRSVLLPPNEKRLGEVCALVAAKTRRLGFRPVTLFGCASKSAGAFLAIRSLLRDAGAKADDIAPSTPLASFARQFWNVFYGPILKLAPTRFPPMNVEANWVVRAGCWGLLAALIALVGTCFGNPYFLAIAAALMGAGVFLCWVGEKLPPKCVSFGELRTFRDLAVAIAGNEPMCRRPKIEDRK